MNFQKQFLYALGQFSSLLLLLCSFYQAITAFQAGNTLDGWIWTAIASVANVLYVVLVREK